MSGPEDRNTSVPRYAGRTPKNTPLDLIFELKSPKMSIQRKMGVRRYARNLGRFYQSE